MKLYRNAEGVWVGTQAEAGNKNIIEVPVDKPGLLEWLNANVTDVSTSNDPVPDVAPVAAAPVSDTRCPKCRLTPKAAQRLADGITVDAIVGKIENSWGFELSRMAEAISYRLQELVNAYKTQSDDARHSVSSSGNDAVQGNDA